MNLSIWIHIFQALCCEPKCVVKVIMSSVVENSMFRWHCRCCETVHVDKDIVGTVLLT